MDNVRQSSSKSRNVERWMFGVSYQGFKAADSLAYGPLGPAGSVLI